MTDGKADPRHSNNISFGNCMLRIPGSLNAEQVVLDEKREIVDIPDNAEVVIRQLWDGKNKPSIKPLMTQFYIWLQSDVMRELYRQMELGIFTKSDNHEIWWVENLLETPIDDNRWYCVWHILVPYLINIKGLSESETSDIISTWLDKCSSLKRLNFSRHKVGYTIRGLKDYHLPIGRDNLEVDNLPLFEKLKEEGVIW